VGSGHSGARDVWRRGAARMDGSGRGSGVAAGARGRRHGEMARLTSGRAELAAAAARRPR
jgi:hypothetical protein